MTTRACTHSAMRSVTKGCGVFPNCWYPRKSPYPSITGAHPTSWHTRPPLLHTTRTAPTSRSDLPEPQSVASKSTASPTASMRRVASPLRLRNPRDSPGRFWPEPIACWNSWRQSCWPMASPTVWLVGAQFGMGLPAARWSGCSRACNPTTGPGWPTPCR